MPCSPSQIVPRSRAVAARERIRTRLVALLSRLDGAGAAHHVVTERSDDALATRLMDAFRLTRDPDVFEGLIEWVRPQLRGRVRARLRRLGAKLDAEEVWQDTIVNIYRYPDRFLANRAGAFAAWSSTIADNVIRRMLRQSRRDVSVCAQDPELLQRASYIVQNGKRMGAEFHIQPNDIVKANDKLNLGFCAALVRVTRRHHPPQPCKLASVGITRL